MITMKKYMCLLCGFIYDEALGIPEEDIPPGTTWEDVPETWRCPDCGAMKEDFEMIEIAA
jgi:rubredoxin